MVAKIIAAVLQLIVILLLARGLAPSSFAVIMSIQAALQVIVVLNGFGLNRQIQSLRSVEPDSPTLALLYSRRLRNTYASAALWSVSLLVTWMITGNSIALALMPTAIWLVFEQITMVWNGIAIVDGRTHRLVQSYVLRRLPVVFVLLLAFATPVPVVWAWSTGIGLGAALACAMDRARQEPWARDVVPTRGDRAHKGKRDLAYWWSEIGTELEGLDVPLVAVINAVEGAVFALPRRLINPMNMVTNAISTVLFPRMVRRSRISRFELAAVVLLGAMPSVGAGALLAVLAGWIPVLVGADYSGAVEVMQVQCIGVGLAGMAQLLLTYLQSRDERSNTFAGVTKLSIGGLHLALIGLGAVMAGAIGASIGLVVSQGILLVLYAWRANRQCETELSDNPNVSIGHVSKHSLGANQ